MSKYIQILLEVRPHFLSDRTSPDCLAEWLSADHSDIMTWSTRVTDTIIFHQLDLKNPTPFGAKSGISLDASVWYAMLNNAVCPIVISPTSDNQRLAQTRRVTYMADTWPNCRGQFNSTGTLADTTNSGPKTIEECVMFSVS